MAMPRPLWSLRGHQLALVMAKSRPPWSLHGHDAIPAQPWPRQGHHSHCVATVSSWPWSHRGHHCILAMVVEWAPSHHILAMTIAWPPSHPGHGRGHHLIPDMTTISISSWPRPQPWSPPHPVLATAITWPWPPSHLGHGLGTTTATIQRQPRSWSSSHSGQGHGHHLIPAMTTASIPSWPRPPWP